MAGASLFTLLDDIASVLDDVAVMTKLAAKKTAGVLGDDLALNAQQVAGVAADRELPVVMRVAVGSAKNKLILVPAAIIISLVAPWAVTPLLMIGGAFLCFEGVEKLVHKYTHSAEEQAEHRAEHLEALSKSAEDVLAVESGKIKGAIRTDFILSAEIIVIALGTVATAPLGQRIAVLVGISTLMTVGVYGLVAGIVKLDDAGLYLTRASGGGSGARLQRGLGYGLLRSAPFLMKGLSIAGTAAMFLVGGGILAHGLPGAEDFIHHMAHAAGGAPVVGPVLEGLIPLLVHAVIGIIAGAVVLLVVMLAQRVLKRS